MTKFELDSRLQDDCYTLGTWGNCYLLLMNNQLVPWFILVPQTTEVEFHRLPQAQQNSLLAAMNELSEFIEQQFNITKINTAAIGNIVRQMHIHIIGRSESDPFWPGVVWGANQAKSYELDQVKKISNLLVKRIKNFRPADLKPKK